MKGHVMQGDTRRPRRSRGSWRTSLFVSEPFALSTSTGRFFYGSRFDVGRRANAASCSAALLLAVAQFRPLSCGTPHGGYVFAENAFRYCANRVTGRLCYSISPSPLSKSALTFSLQLSFMQLLVKVTFSVHLCGRHGDFQDARAFGSPGDHDAALLRPPASF